MAHSPNGARSEHEQPDHRQFVLAVICASPVVRSGLEQVLARAPGLVVRHCVDSVPALQACATVPDLVVIDLYPIRGARVDAAFWAALPSGCRAIALCRPEDPPDLITALHAGSRAFLTRESDVDELLLAVRIAADGGVHLTAELTRHLVAQTSKDTGDRRPLSRREVETLRWVAAGLTHSQVSHRMSISEATVSAYVKRIRGKLNAGNKADLTRLAIELGYVAGR